MTYCGRCALTKIKKQIKGIARIYIRPLKPDSSGGTKLSSRWVIYIVPSGHRLKEYMGRANWSIEVEGHPMRRHVCIDTIQERKHGK